jgi:hypothetical protein
LISSSGICGEIFSKSGSTSNRCSALIFHPFWAEYYHKLASIRSIKKYHISLLILNTCKFFRNSLYQFICSIAGWIFLPWFFHMIFPRLTDNAKRCNFVVYKGFNMRLIAWISARCGDWHAVRNKICFFL